MFGINPSCFAVVMVPCTALSRLQQVVGDAVKGKDPVLDIAQLHDEHMLRSALQSRKWQLTGMS